MKNGRLFCNSRYVHNALVADNTVHVKFTHKVNSTARESTSYTALIWTGERSGVLDLGCADLRCPPEKPFSIRFSLD